MEKKYEFTEETIADPNNRILHRIRALRSFGNVKAGELGGYVEKEANLSHDGTCWVYDDAHVYEDAKIFGKAQVYDDAHVYGDAKISGNAHVYGTARVCSYAQVYEDANVFGEAWVYDDAHVYGEAWVYDSAQVYGTARVHGRAWVCDYGDVGGNAMVSGDVQIINDTASYDSMVVDNINQIFFAGYLGSRNDTAYFIYTNGNIHVQCGCFKGNVDEFEDRVKDVYGIDNVLGRSYLGIANYVRTLFAERFPAP